MVAGAAALLADAVRISTPVGCAARCRGDRAPSGRRRHRQPRPRSRIRGRARRRPARRGARRARRGGHPGDGHRHAPQRLASGPRRPSAARVGHDRGDGDDEPRPCRAPAGRVAHRLDHRRGRRSPRGAGSAHRRGARIGPARPATSDPVERRRPGHAAAGREPRASVRRVVPRERHHPAVLAFVAGRVDGTRERPQLLPLELLDVELYRGARRVGRLARLRDVLPGRYAFGLTGRGPAGARLPRGGYVVRIVGTPVGGGPPTSVDVSFRLR